MTGEKEPAWRLYAQRASIVILALLIVLFLVIFVLPDMGQGSHVYNATEVTTPF